MFDKNLFNLPSVKGVFGALLLIAIAMALLELGQYWFLSCGLSWLWAGGPWDLAWPFLVNFALCFVAIKVATYVCDCFLDRWACDISSSLRHNLLQLLFCNRKTLRQEEGVTHLVNSATSGMDSISAYLRSGVRLVANLASVPVILGLVAFVDPVSAVILGLSLPVIVMFMRILSALAKDRASIQYENYKDLANHFIDSIQGLSVTRGASDEILEREADEVVKASETVREASIKTIAVATLSGTMLDFIATMAVAAVAMMLAFRLIDHSIDLQSALYVLMLSPAFYVPVRSFAAGFHESLDARTALERYNAILASESNRTSEQDSLPNKISVDVGKCYGVIGESGAGKTTLLNALANEVSVNSVHYIPQDPYIFRASLLENLRFYDPSIPESRAVEVAESVGLGPLLQSLPHGVHSLIGQGNRHLSGGEARRVAMARALLSPRPLVLLDEPTAGLDIATECQLKPIIAQLKQKSAVVFATHRLHWKDVFDETITISKAAASNEKAEAPHEA